MRRLTVSDSVLEHDLDIFLSQRMVPRGTELTATWLLDGCRERWVLAADNGRTRQSADGEWIDAKYIRWSRLLPNGKYLTDDDYADTLEDCWRLIFGVRSGFDATITRTNQQCLLADETYVLLNWMALRGFAEPATFLRFSSLTVSDFNEFCRDVIYGAPALELWEQRITAALEATLGAGLIIPRNAAGIINWEWLGQKINVEPRRLSTFVPADTRLRDLLGKAYSGPYVHSGRTARREYIGHRTRLINETIDRPLSETRVAGLLEPWGQLSRQNHVMGNLLAFNPFEDFGPSKLAIQLGAVPMGRTYTVPTPIALFYLDRSINWVQKYGSVLIKYAHDLESKYIEIRGDGTSRRDYYAPQAFACVPIPPILADLNIARLHEHPGGTSLATIRNQMSVVTAIQCLYAACFIVIAMLSIRRVTELLELLTDCMTTEFDGLDLKFGLLKSSALPPPEMTSRPVPPTVGTCVNLLLRLTEPMRTQTNDPVLRQTLFLDPYAPSTADTGQLSYNKLRSYLDLFADIIEVPLLPITDKHQVQRRCYIEPHECRRFLPHAFFSYQSNPDLSALSWFMGHLAPRQLLRYLQEQLAGQEFAEHAATYTAEALYTDTQRKDLKALKQLTLNQFHVSAIEYLQPYQLEAYLSSLYEQGSLSVAIRNFPVGEHAFPIAIELRRSRQ